MYMENISVVNIWSVKHEDVLMSTSHLKATYGIPKETVHCHVHLTFIRLFIFIICFILVKVMVELESILGTLGTTWDYGPSQGTMYTHMHSNLRQCIITNLLRHHATSPAYPKCSQSAKTCLLTGVCFFSFAPEAGVANKQSTSGMAIFNHFFHHNL